MRRLTFLLICIVPNANAQSRAVSGRVVDSAGRAIPEVRVEIAGSFQYAKSASKGEFVLRGPKDSFALTARRLGYRPAVKWVPRDDSIVEIKMFELPVRLSGVVVPATSSLPLGQTLTRESVRNVPALGEPDMLRALPFVNAVSQPNDMMSVVHIAGAAADEASFAVDGHPVQAPTHYMGMFSGVNLTGIDRVEVLSGHLPTTVPTRVGGVIEIQTRAASTRDREIGASLLSSGATIVQPHAFGNTALMASARVTYLDRLLKAAGVGNVRGDQVSAPTYGDALIKLVVPVRDSLRVEPLFLFSEDRYDPGAQSPESWKATTFRESLAGLRFSGSRKGLATELRVSSDELSVRNPGITPGGADRLRIRQRLRSVSLQVRAEPKLFQVTGSLGMDSRQYQHSWTNMRFRPELSPFLPGNRDTSEGLSLLFGGLEVSRFVTRSLVITAGTRADVAAESHSFSPTLRMRWIGSRTTVLVSADRRVQYDGEYGPRVEETLIQPLFLFRTPRTSVGVASTFTIESSGPRLLLPTLSVTGFARSTDRRPIGVDTRLTSSNEVEFGYRNGRVFGATISTSLIRGPRLSVQGAYTYQRAYERDEVEWSRADWDVPHTVSGVFGVPLSAKWSVTGAVQWHSGLPITPISQVLFTPMLPEPVRFESRFEFGARNAARLPAYERLDVGVNRTWKIASSEWIASAQVVNALRARNVYGYDWRTYLSAIASGRQPPSNRPGLPFLPSIGVTVRW